MTAAVWLLAFAANLVCLAPDQALEDTAELLACALSFGNAHPPGYPLHALAGRLAMLIPVGSIGFRVNLLSAAASASAALLAFVLASDLARRLGAGRAAGFAGLGSAAAFAVVPTGWWHATIADKYAVFVMSFALASFAFWRWASSRQPRDLFLASFATGLALACHLMGLYLLPVFAWMLWRARGPRVLAVSVLLFCLPVTLKVAYPVLRASADPGVNCSVPDRPGRLVRYLLVRAYGDRFYARAEVPAMARESLAHAVRVIGGEAGPQLVLAACGLIVLWRAVPPAAAGALGLMAANLVIAMPFRDAQAYGQMYMAALWIVSVLAGAGAGAFGALWRPFAAAGLAIAAVQGLVNLSGADQSRSFIAADHARNLTAGLPPNALVIAHDERWLAPLWYLREADPAWRGLILITRDHLKPLQPERASLERVLGTRASLIRGYEDAPPVFPRLAMAVPAGVFCGLASMPVPSTGMAWHGLLVRAGAVEGASWVADAVCPRLWRSFRLRSMWRPRTRREKSLVHAYAGLMHEEGTARAGTRLDPTFPPRWAARDAALRAGRGDRKAAARGLTDRGFALSLQERYFEAARSWTDALALDPGQAMAMNGLGELALTEERFPDAVRWFGDACARMPASGCRDGIDRTRTAASAAAGLAGLERATASRSATAFCELGNAYWRMNRLRTAEATYRRALAIDPGYARAWGNLGSALAEQDRLPDAAGAYLRAHALAPGNADTMLNLGVVFGRMGDRKRARTWLERCLSARPGDPAATALLKSVGQ